MRQVDEHSIEQLERANALMRAAAAGTSVDDLVAALRANKAADVPL